MTWWVPALIAWPLVGLGVAYLFGRLIRGMQSQESTDDQPPVPDGYEVTESIEEHLQLSTHRVPIHRRGEYPKRLLHNCLDKRQEPIVLISMPVIIGGEPGVGKIHDFHPLSAQHGLHGCRRVSVVPGCAQDYNRFLRRKRHSRDG
jgi:hypothetical protein